MVPSTDPPRNQGASPDGRDHCAATISPKTDGGARWDPFSTHRVGVGGVGSKGLGSSRALTRVLAEQGTGLGVGPHPPVTPSPQLQIGPTTTTRHEDCCIKSFN